MRAKAPSWGGYTPHREPGWFDIWDARDEYVAAAQAGDLGRCEQICLDVEDEIRSWTHSRPRCDEAAYARAWLVDAARADGYDFDALRIEGHAPPKLKELANRLMEHQYGNGNGGGRNVARQVIASVIGCNVRTLRRWRDEYLDEHFGEMSEMSD